MGTMDKVKKLSLTQDQASLWFLGQAGYIARAGDRTLAIDPYLTDSVAKTAPEYSRIVPVPIAPEDLDVDVFIVTHDHLDHLDPETIARYDHKDTTTFVAPRLAAKKLARLGIRESCIVKIDSGETCDVRGLNVTGVYAIPTDAAVIDTTGYKITFANGRSFYHSSDTSYSEVLKAAVPNAEVLLVCINGKWGNLSIAEAAIVAASVQPRFALPNHYYLMALNSADPEEFVARMEKEHPEIPVRITRIMEPFIWS